MAFLQIIDVHSSKVDELVGIDREWRAATEGKRTLRRSIVARDRNDPDRHLILAFFDDYESAMANSNLPETAEFARKQAALVDREPIFIDLDIIEDET